MNVREHDCEQALQLLNPAKWFRGTANKQVVDQYGLVPGKL
jgi:hypothetical protein